MIDCAKKTIQREGFRGLYKGMSGKSICKKSLTLQSLMFRTFSAPLSGVAPIFAISFFGFGVGKRLQQNSPDEELNYTQLFMAGAFSGIFTTSVRNIYAIKSIEILINVFFLRSWHPVSSFLLALSVSKFLALKVRTYRKF